MEPPSGPSTCRTTNHSIKWAPWLSCTFATKPPSDLSLGHRAFSTLHRKVGESGCSVAALCHHTATLHFPLNTTLHLSWASLLAPLSELRTVFPPTTPTLAFLDCLPNPFDLQGREKDPVSALLPFSPPDSFFPRPASPRKGVSDVAYRILPIQQICPETEPSSLH